MMQAQHGSWAIPWSLVGNKVTYEDTLWEITFLEEWGDHRSVTSAVDQKLWAGLPIYSLRADQWGKVTLHGYFRALLPEAI